MTCWLWFGHKWKEVKKMARYEIVGEIGGFVALETVLKCEKCGDVKKKD